MMMSNQLKYWLKLNGLPKNYQSLPFGRQIEYRRIIAEFKESAKSTHISIKRRTPAAALKEFKDLYNPSEFYAVFHDSPTCRDDAFEVWYKEKSNGTSEV